MTAPVAEQPPAPRPSAMRRFNYAVAHPSEWLRAICGGESAFPLLVLFGLLLPLGTAMLFDLLHLKADLGALIAGLLIGGHPKSNELAKTLLGFKDLFLTGFFLSIGFYGPPAMTDILVAVVLTVIMPLKVILFFVVMTRFRLRARRRPQRDPC